MRLQTSGSTGPTMPPWQVGFRHRRRSDALGAPGRATPAESTNLHVTLFWSAGHRKGIIDAGWTLSGVRSGPRRKAVLVPRERASSAPGHSGGTWGRWWLPASDRPKQGLSPHAIVSAAVGRRPRGSVPCGLLRRIPRMRHGEDEYLESGDAGVPGGPDRTSAMV